MDLFILDARQYRSAERFCVRDGHLVLIPMVQDPRCFLTELAAPDRTMGLVDAFDTTRLPRFPRLAPL